MELLRPNAQCHFALIFMSHVPSIVPKTYRIFNEKEFAVLEWDQGTQVAAYYILSSQLINL